ncbi:pectate lyase family protein [Bythopirellula goksoeyrii]|nr:T9SS C-terminal target domain-containing protein [Bythopirellula goksoeyrii]
MDTGRSDTATPGWVEWQVPNGTEASKTFEGIQVRLRPAGGGKAIEGQWYKAALATGATMATDGVAVQSNEGPASIELEIDGLKPGRHSLVTYHNTVSDSAAGSYSISINSNPAVEGVTPTSRVPVNEDAESAYLEFDTKLGQPVIVSVSADSGDRNHVIINGIEIDGSDPKHKARVPAPENGDSHADGDSGQLHLTWNPAASSKKHLVYVTSDEDADRAEKKIANAVEESELMLGSTTDSSFDLKVDPNASQLFYCWRVDSVDGAGKVTRGDVWKFRVRHLAFPGAEGYGRFAIGGRGGRVIKVTNLDDSGPGSLRAAVEAKGPRTVVFDVGGRIVLQDRLIIRDPYLTLAGQTAPGKGICISNYNLGLLGAHDCILRFLRVRPGDTSGKTLDGMGMASCDNSIVDHCSISWTQDEAFSSRGAKDITLQRTLISEALNVAGHKKYKEGTQHGYAASIGGDIGSFHHNLLAHCAGRNWSLAGGLDKATRHAGRLDIRNNVVYNWSHRTTDGGAREVNFVNNYYKPGASTKVFHVLMAEREAVPSFGPQKYYVDGNVMEGRFDASQKLSGVFERHGEPHENWIVEEPFFKSYVSTTTAEDAFEDVLADVGCNRPVLDDHDKRVIEETRSGTTTYEGSVTGYPGLPDSQEDVGGWEEYPETHRPADWDTDGDGMPKWWEKRQGLNPNSAPNDFSESNDDANGDGYTNIEEYHQWMATNGYSE